MVWLHMRLLLPPSPPLIQQYLKKIKLPTDSYYDGTLQAVKTYLSLQHLHLQRLKMGFSWNGKIFAQSSRPLSCGCVFDVGIFSFSFNCSHLWLLKCVYVDECYICIVQIFFLHYRSPLTPKVRHLPVITPDIVINCDVIRRHYIVNYASYLTLYVIMRRIIVLWNCQPSEIVRYLKKNSSNKTRKRPPGIIFPPESFQRWKKRTKRLNCSFYWGFNKYNTYKVCSHTQVDSLRLLSNKL